MASPDIILFINPSTKTCHGSLFSEAVKSIPSPTRGERWSIGVVIVDRVPKTLEDQRLFSPRDVTGDNIRVTVGRRTRETIVDGHYTITATNNVGPSTATTADIDWNANAATVSARLNALGNITASGGVTVTTSPIGFFFEFNNNGARDYDFTGDGTETVPNTSIQFSRVVVGDADTKEKWEFWIETLAPFRATLATPFTTATSPVTVLQTGGGGFNHLIRVRLLGDIYAGSWQIIIGAVTSKLISFTATEEEITSQIEDMSTVGGNNVEVSKEEDGAILIHFIEGKANTNMGAITALPNGLRVLPGKIGDLSFTGSEIKRMLESNTPTTSIDLSFEVDWTPATQSKPNKCLSDAITILESVNDPEDQTNSNQPELYLGVNYRVKDGVLSIKNDISGAFHRIDITGNAGEEQLVIGIAEA